MSSSTGPSGHWPGSCACCAFRGGGSTSAPGRPLCTSLTDIVESRRRVVPRTSRPVGAGVAEPCAFTTPAGTAGHPAQARKSAHALPRWSRCGRLSSHTEVNRPHQGPVRDGWAIFPEESGRPRTLREPGAGVAKRGKPHTRRAPDLRGAIDTAMRGQSHSPRAARCRVCVFCRAPARSARSAPDIPGEIGAGHPWQRGAQRPRDGLHLTPTALRNKVNQHGGKCASRFPGRFPFGGCPGRKATGHGRRNRAM
jgi:hypothetical protein